MGSAERRARHKENLRRAILDAARELFVTEGYENVSLRKIADKIEYSPTAIYLHFKDKEEILIELSEEGFLLLREHVAALDIADPVERLRQGCARYFEFALNQSHYYRIMFEIEANPMVKYHQDVEETCGYRAYTFIRDAVIQAQRENRFAQEYHPDIAAHIVWSGIHGAASLVLSGRLGGVVHQRGDEFRQAVFTSLIESLLNGLCPHNTAKELPRPNPA